MNIIFSISESHLEGISEFDLLKELEKNGFVKENDSDADYDIDIHCLKIQLIPLQVRQNNKDYALNVYDPLASY